ncbi:MAG: glutathione peroxidase [Myxococcota bacterium]
MSLALTGAPEEKKPVESFYDLTAKALDGQDTALSKYKGKVTLVVNVASECGFTPQYEGLEKLYEEMKDKGVVVLGFPSNEFGGQEPGTAEQIQTFCKTKYGIKFPMFEKVETKGKNQHAVYGFLTAKHGEPKWNFHKYLVGKDGKVIAAFPSKVAPDSPELRQALQKALGS